MDKLKIAILGTRGIPNNYGGFEECAERLSGYFVKEGHLVTVYNPDVHPFKKDYWNGVKIRKVFSKENRLKFLGNFIFDYLSLKDAVKRENDIILELGYSPSALFYTFIRRKRSKIVTNMDGLDWKRSKWSRLARALLKYSEKLAVKKSDALISDNPGIQEYIKSKYGADSYFVPYGAEEPEFPEESYINGLGLKKGEYFLLVARLEPENNIEMILEGYKSAGSIYPFIIVGPMNTYHAGYLSGKYRNETKIEFLGGIYNKKDLDSLRSHCTLYFHGHSVGGTNPALLEAMAAGAPIAAHDNIFNKSVLKEDALYFKSSEDIKINIIKQSEKGCSGFSRRNKKKISEIYSWRKISEEYLKIFYKLINIKKKILSSIVIRV